MESEGAKAPHLESDAKYEKVSQVSLLFWSRLQRVVSVLLLCACLYLAKQSGWFLRSSPVTIKQPRIDLSTMSAPVIAPVINPVVQPVLEESGSIFSNEKASEPHVEEVLPSWNASSPDSCDGFFGNGYEENHVVVKDALECNYHPKLTATYCVGKGVIVHPDRIQVSKGGEKVEEVMGRKESEEEPKFESGALQIVEGGLKNLEDGVHKPWGEGLGTEYQKTPLKDLLSPDPYKREMLQKAQFLPKDSTLQGSCGTRITDPVLMVTRMEYANLFHTSTDWYNVWSVARILGLEPVEGKALEKLINTATFGLSLTTQVTQYPYTPKIPAHVIFLDGHNAGPMDDGWLGLFVSISYIKHFDGAVCFENLIFAPFGFVQLFEGVL